MEERYIRRDDYITKYLKEMEVFAKNNNVPIVRKQTLSVILDLVKNKVEVKEKNKKEIKKWILKIKNEAGLKDYNIEEKEYIEKLIKNYNIKL